MKIDGRRLDHASLEQIRLMAIRRVREGENPGVVIASYGFNRTTIYKWMRMAAGSGNGLMALSRLAAPGGRVASPRRKSGKCSVGSMAAIRVNTAWILDCGRAQL